MIQAQWGGIIFEVSKRCVKPIKSIETGTKLDYERKEDSEGAPPTQVVRRGLQTLKIKYDALACLGTWPKIEFEGWAWVMAQGQHAPFYINGESFFDREFIVTNVSLSSEVLNSSGVMIYGELTIDMEEYAEEAGGLKIDKGVEINFTPGIQTYNQSALEASLRARASTNDKMLSLKSVIGGAHHVIF